MCVRKETGLCISLELGLQLRKSFDLPFNLVSDKQKTATLVLYCNHVVLDVFLITDAF